MSSVSESMSSLILYCQINSNTNHTQLEKFLSKIIKINSSILHENIFGYSLNFRSNFLYFDLLLKYFKAQNARIISFFTQPYKIYLSTHSIWVLDTIEDHGTQIRRVWLGDLTILSNFHIETSSFWSVSDYECHL